MANDYVIESKKTNGELTWFVSYTAPWTANLSRARRFATASEAEAIRSSLRASSEHEEINVTWREL